MTSIQVRPGPLAGTVAAPSSKSATHRALLLAAQSQVPCTVATPLLSADTRATLGALHALGASLAMQPNGDVRFTPSRLAPARRVLDCANSGTTLRLMTATVARFGAPVSLDGDASLRGRPNAALHEALRTLGARIDAKDGKAPVTVSGPIRAGDVTLPAATSSQFGSALLLSLPFLDGDSSLTMASPVHSAPYLDITVRMAHAFRLRIDDLGETAHGRQFRIPGRQHPTQSRVVVEGDWSSAAFPLAAAVLTRGRVTVTNLDAASPQGDRAILDLLARFAPDIARDQPLKAPAQAPTPNPGAIPEPARLTLDATHATLRAAGHIDIGAHPDLFPVLATVAAAAPGTTTFGNAAALRHKESDRIAAMQEGLTRLGAKVTSGPDWMRIDGGTLKGARLASHGDHRIHMALTVAGLAATGATTIDDTQSAAVSYPHFHEDLRRLGARLSTEGHA